MKPTEKSGLIRSRQELAGVRRLVVKVGSALLADSSSDIFQSLSQEIAALMKQDVEVVLVSSGAIALGLSQLGLKKRPHTLPLLQAAAATGQTSLMSKWQTHFEKSDISLGQILLTHGDMRDRKRYLNAKFALEALLQKRVLPVVNENDTVSVEEIRFGDNDALAADVASLLSCPLLVLLTRAEGVMTEPPEESSSAQRIGEIQTPGDLSAYNLGTANTLGTGGMQTKLIAANAAQQHGSATVIADGRKSGILSSILAGEDIGTFVPGPTQNPHKARKRWISQTLRPQGEVVVDAGAKTALVKGASLLFAGVVSIKGDFEAGDAVDIYCEDEPAPFGRGLITLAALEAAKLAGVKSWDAQKKHAEPLPGQLIHRDDMAFFK